MSLNGIRLWHSKQAATGQRFSGRGGGGGSIGGGGGSYFANNLAIDGTLVALGLPDNVPQPQIVTKEVIKEVPKEVIKEVVKEVPKEVTVETISPISYAAIGIGIVIAVVGIVLSRRRKAS